MTDQEFRDLLHGSTSDLSPDVAALVSGGAARGRSRRRRHLVGTSVATVLSVGAVAAGSALLTSGGGTVAEDGGFAGGGRSVVDASVATHDATHRLLAEDRFTDALVAMLPDDGDTSAAAGGSIGSAGSAGGGDKGQTLTTSVQWRGGEVSVTVSDGVLVGPVAVAEGETPPEPTPYAGPEEACRTAERDSAVEVTRGCREVDNGDWVLVTAGPTQVGLSGYVSSSECEAVPGSCDSVDDADWSMAWGDGSTVSLLTTDGWQVSASATAPKGSDEPVLGDADLQLMTQDGDWFLAPGEEPPAPPTAGLNDPDGSVSSDGSVSTMSPGPDNVSPDAPTTSNRKPVLAERLPEVFDGLLPGKVSEVDLEGGDPDRPAAKFRWDGLLVAVTVAPVTRVSCQDSTADECESPTDGSASGIGGGPGAAPKVVAVESYTEDGWLVRLEVSADGQTAPTAEKLLAAAGSDDWFRD